MSIFPTKILLATDSSREAQLAATTVAELVKATGSELHVVHVDPLYVYYRAVRTEETEEQAQKVLDEQVDRLRNAGVDVAEAHLREGLPAEVIVALAEDLSAGLIVMGSRGLGGIRRALMGSVSDSVVRHAHCPVMVVRPNNERSAGYEADPLLKGYAPRPSSHGHELRQAA
jgi:nucleotide-binding universal stress UspA family protein